MVVGWTNRHRLGMLYSQLRLWPLLGISWHILGTELKTGMVQIPMQMTQMYLWGINRPQVQLHKALVFFLQVQ